MLLQSAKNYDFNELVEKLYLPYYFQGIFVNKQLFS